MKKSVLLLSILFLILTSINASEDIYDLPLKQQQRYLQNSLSIEMGTETSGMIGTGILGNAYFFALSSLESTTSQTWTPYRGKDPISKSKFFDLVNDRETKYKILEWQKERESNKKAMWAFYGTGLAVSSIGLIAMLTAASGDEASDMLPGYLITAAGLGITCMGIPFEIKSNAELRISAQYAINMADIYNRDLYQRLKVDISM